MGLLDYDKIINIPSKNLGVNALLIDVIVISLQIYTIVNNDFLITFFI